MELDMVADMEVDKVAGLTSTLTPTLALTLTLTFTSTSTSTWKSNLVRELVTWVGLLGPNFLDSKLSHIHQHFHFPELRQQRNGKNGLNAGETKPKRIKIKPKASVDH